MKKTLKIIGIAIGVLLLIVLCGFIFINVRGIPSYDVVDFEYELNSTPESIARGEKLTTMLCAGCHIDRHTGQLSGKRMLDGPPEFGVIYSPNITQDSKYGIGEWTDAELVYLLRTGIKRDGKYAPPYMAKLPNMADEDLDAIISFLRSDHEMVKAAKVEDKPTEPSFLTKFLCYVAFKPMPMPENRIEMPDTADVIQLGKYLVHNLDCFTCHSVDFKTINFIEPIKTPGYLGGGNSLLDMDGNVMSTPNITPDLETGIGSWTEEQFVKAVKYSFIEGDKALQYPMLPYVGLTDYEAGAIFRYLKTVPPIKNKVERTVYD